MIVYDVRINGTIVAIDLTTPLQYAFTGLTASGSYVASVRSHDTVTGFYSPWVDISFSALAPVGIGNQIIAQPHGLEAWWEYDWQDVWALTGVPGSGFVFNDHRGSSRAGSAGQGTYGEGFFVTEVGGLDDADVRDSREVNPDDDGETAYRSRYGGRTLTFTGYIVAPNLARLRLLWQSLRSAFVDLKDHYLIFHSNTDDSRVVIRCRKSSGLASREVQDKTFWRRDVLLTLRAADPRFLSYLQHSENHVPTASLFLGHGYSRTYPRGYSVALDSTGLAQPLTSFRLTNLGNYKTKPLFMLIGPMTNPILVNNTTGERFQLQTTIVAGDSIFIDMGKRTIVNSAGQNLFYILTADSQWLTLVPGMNDISLIASSLQTGANATVYFRDAWQ